MAHNKDWTYPEKSFLDEGDIVLCESPTYLAAISAFKAYGCSFIEIPTDEDGMMMDVLEDVLSNTPAYKTDICHTYLSESYRKNVESGKTQEAG